VFQSLNLLMNLPSILDLPYAVPVQPAASKGIHRLQCVSMHSRHCSLLPLVWYVAVGHFAIVGFPKASTGGTKGSLGMSGNALLSTARLDAMKHGVCIEQTCR
jgi:hypothetical protein